MFEPIGCLKQGGFVKCDGSAFSSLRIVSGTWAGDHMEKDGPVKPLVVSCEVCVCFFCF